MSLEDCVIPQESRLIALVKFRFRFRFSESA